MKKQMLLSFTVIFLFTHVFSITANAYTPRRRREVRPRSRTAYASGSL